MNEKQAIEIVRLVLRHAGFNFNIELDHADDMFPFIQIGDDFSIGLQNLSLGKVTLTRWDIIPETREAPEDVHENVLLEATDLVQAILRIINELHAVTLENAWQYADYLVDRDILVDAVMDGMEGMVLPWPKPGQFFVHKDHVNAVLNAKSNIDVQSNVVLARWYHTPMIWLSKLRYKLRNCLVV